MLIKAPILNKCVNYFCPWKYESVFSSLSFDAAEFSRNEVALVWGKYCLFINKNLYIFILISSLRTIIKMYKAYCCYLTLYSHGISDTLSGQGELICVMVTANNIITCMSLIPVISVIVIQGLTCVQLHNFAFRQWGTKVLRHFCEMASFSIVDIPMPFLCVPPPPPPKTNAAF